MPFTTLVGGLELVIPTDGTTNWGQTLLTSTWQKINDHRHTGGGDGNQLTGGSFAANSLTGTQLSKNLALTTATTLTPAGTTETIDWDNGNIQKLDLSSATGNVTLTLSNPNAGAFYTILIDQGGTVRTCVWPAAVQWEAGSNGEPTQYADASSRAIIYLHYDGTVYNTIYSINQS